MHVSESYQNSLCLNNQGDKMSVGCSMMDYRVHIGAGICEVSSLSPTTLECNPPIEKPPSDPDNQHLCKDTPNTLPLVVTICTVKYNSIVDES